MSGLIAGTDVIRADEPSMGLSEINMQAPDSKGFRRYRVVHVMRNDRPAEFRFDMGLAENFQAEQFWIPGGFRDRNGRYYIEHTVGELMDMADRVRAGMHADPEPPSPGDLIGGYHDLPDKHRRKRRRLSQFGYGGATQRG